MKKISFIIFLSLLSGSGLFLTDFAFGEEGLPPEREIEALDPQIQQLKEEILDLNTLLFQLQEDLLFPEDSSLVIFLSMEGGNYFALDSVKVNLDNTLVTSYLYTHREVSALKKRGNTTPLYRECEIRGTSTGRGVYGGGPSGKGLQKGRSHPF